ncbi:hypothetical protein DBR42_01415 [Pelomonas sp. HMWF004]|nr:hypothetical protein DBR42_01415 [Pelomonas sp. HMWF004]
MRELYDISSVVAVVEVIDGRVVDAGGDTCGARYRSRVIEGTKNARAGQLIDFGFRPHLKIGARYFVLLHEFKYVEFHRFPDFQDRCRGALPELALAGFGRGAMEVTASGGEPEKRESWTVRRERGIEYPIGTRSKPVDGEQQLVFTDMVKRMKDGAPDIR